MLASTGKPPRSGEGVGGKQQKKGFHLEAPDREKNGRPRRPSRPSGGSGRSGDISTHGGKSCGTICQIGRVMKRSTEGREKKKLGLAELIQT